MSFTIKLLSMTNNNKHQIHNPVFSRQSYLRIEQNLPTSGLAAAGQRTNIHHPARQTRLNPLNVYSDISRVSDRLPADRVGEWPNQSTHQDPSLLPNIRNRAEAVPTHGHLSGSSGGRASHQRQVVTLMHFDATKNSNSRPNVTRDSTGGHTPTSRRHGRGAPPIDPDNSRNAFTQTQRPRGGVRQDKVVLTNALSASQQPAPLTKGGRAHIVNKDSPRSQNATRLQNVSGSRLKLIHTTTWLPPAIRAEIERIAGCEKLAVSQVCAIGLGQWVRQRLHDQHEETLYPVLRQLIRDELRSFGNRLVFLMRIAFAAEQTRILTTNLLNRYLKHQGVPDETFNSLVDKSNKMAKRNIIARTPELKSLMEEWWAYLPDDTENNNREEKKHG
jgi:hypothetical protein